MLNPRSGTIRLRKICQKAIDDYHKRLEPYTTQELVWRCRSDALWALAMLCFVRISMGERDLFWSIVLAGWCTAFTIVFLIDRAVLRKRGKDK